MSTDKLQMSRRCRLGFHRYEIWSESRLDRYGNECQQKICRRCAKVIQRVI